MDTHFPELLQVLPWSGGAKGFMYESIVIKKPMALREARGLALHQASSCRDNENNLEDTHNSKQSCLAGRWGEVVRVAAETKHPRQEGESAVGKSTSEMVYRHRNTRNHDSTSKF